MKIVYISYYYPPCNHIAGQRSSKIISTLRQLGHEVKVIASLEQGGEYVYMDNYVHHKDDIYFNHNDLKSSTHHKFKLQLSSLKFYLMNILLNSAFLIWLASFFFKIRMLGGDVANWDSKTLLPQILKKLEGYNPDLIISTSGPIENHIIAKSLKLYLSIPWVAEYRDPWSFNPMSPFHAKDNFLNKILRYKEGKIIKYTDLVFGASNFICSYYSKEFALKTELLYGGWQEKDPNNLKHYLVKKVDGKINILHLGSSLKGRRSIDWILGILQRNGNIRNRFNFYFIGRDTDFYQRKLKGFNKVENNIYLYNEISDDLARVEGAASDFLLLLMMDNIGERYTVTGKIFEYIYLQKPIICLDKHQSEASKIISEYKMGHVFESESSFENFLENFNSVEKCNVISNDDKAKFEISNILSSALNKVNLYSK